LNTTDHPTIELYHPTRGQTAELEAVISEFGHIEASLDALAQRAWKALIPALAASQAASASGVLTADNEDEFNKGAWGAAWKLNDIAENVQRMFGPASQDFDPATAPGWYVAAEDPQSVRDAEIRAEVEAERAERDLTVSDETVPTEKATGARTWINVERIVSDELRAEIRALVERIVAITPEVELLGAEAKRFDQIIDDRGEELVDEARTVFDFDSKGASFVDGVYEMVSSVSGYRELRDRVAAAHEALGGWL